jgi:formamidopyrimidine-DNA glycosylase
VIFVPELPDVTVYVEALGRRTLGQRLTGVQLNSPFLLRTVEPALDGCVGRRVAAVSRLGKRLVLELEGDLALVLHLMIAGRLHWKAPGASAKGRTALASFAFESGTLLLTEAGTKKRAALHVVAGRRALVALDRGGLDVLHADLASFRQRLTEANHTLKRALCDPTRFDGIGNAYSDEILHRARLSPLALTQRLDDEEIARLHSAAVCVLREWIERLRRQAGDSFPEHVTAFRPEMAVHGRFRQACPACNAPVQRIVYAEHETNYCARCQTGGRILADRALSRLLKDDWPRSIEAWEG